MARSLTTDQRNALSADGVVKCELVELLFDTPMRLCNAGRNVTWNGHTWIGDGSVLSIPPMRENLALQAHGMQIELSGDNAALVSFALNGLGKGKTMNLYVAAISPTTGAVIAASLESSLRIDTMVVFDGGDA